MKRIISFSALAIIGILFAACSRNEIVYEGMYRSIDIFDRTILYIYEYKGGKTGIMVTDASESDGSIAVMTVLVENGDTIADFHIPNGKHPKPGHGDILARQKISYGDKEYPLLYLHHANKAFMKAEDFEVNEEKRRVIKALMSAALLE